MLNRVQRHAINSSNSYSHGSTQPHNGLWSAPTQTSMFPLFQCFKKLRMKQVILRDEDNYSCTLSQEIQEIARRELQVRILKYLATIRKQKTRMRF